MGKLAILVLLLMCTAAFAAPTITNDLQPGPSSVDGENNREKETGLSSEELADDMKAAKELSELEFFRFYTYNTRVDQILESYLVARSEQTEILDESLTPENIRQAIKEYRRTIHPEWEINDDVKESDTMDAYLSKHIGIEQAQIKLCLDAARGQTILEAMEKIQYRGNDDIMDLLLKKEIGKELEDEKRTKFDGLNIQQIRRPNPGCSLARGDELLIDHMSKEFGFDELKTRQLIQRARQKMLERVDGDSFGLSGYSDDVAVDTWIGLLLEDANAERLEIDLAIDQARAKINREKKTLDAEQLQAYDSDQKMSELLHPLEVKYGIPQLVEEARWQNTLSLGIRYRKSAALRNLMGSGRSYSTWLVEQHIRELAAISKDQVAIKILETLFKFSGFDSPSIGLRIALTEEYANTFVLISLLKLEGATHPTEDELALEIENHPAVKAYRESVRISDEDVAASAEHAIF